MEHYQETPVEPIKSSTSEFGVENQNHFVVLDDSKHIIGLDADDLTKMILEDVDKGSKVEFGLSTSTHDLITSLLYDEDAGSLYIGNGDGHLRKYKLDIANQICKEVKDFGKLGIRAITSSHRFLHFVFFGGSDGKIRVLDLLRGKLLRECFMTSIKSIISLQVSVESAQKIYLAVSGNKPNYSNDKTDLFDLSDFLKDIKIPDHYFSKSPKKHNCLPNPKNIKFQKHYFPKNPKKTDSLQTQSLNTNQNHPRRRSTSTSSNSSFVQPDSSMNYLVDKIFQKLQMFLVPLIRDVVSQTSAKFSQTKTKSREPDHSNEDLQNKIVSILNQVQFDITSKKSI